MSTSARRYVQATAIDAAGTEPDGYYPTEAPVARAIVALEDWPALVWEPACGCGVIVRAFAEAAPLKARDVLATDLVFRGVGQGGCDFMKATRLPWSGRGGGAIVTNPPFAIATEFASHALDLGVDKLALLLRLNFLGGVGKRHDRRRRDLLDRRGLARVRVSAARTTMKRGGTDGGKGGGSMIEFAWFVWERGHTGPAQLSRFDWRDF